MKTKQRGSAWSIKLVFNLYKIFGYNFIYYLMYPVTFFYFIFASNVRKSLKVYYKQLDLPFDNYIYFTHLRLFANCMVDRFISKFSPESYSFEYDNKEEFAEILDEGTVLLSSHHGGWATAANVPLTQNTINIVMQEVLLDGIKDIENSIEKQNHQVNIIDLNEGGIASSIKIANALMENQVVAMMADRANDKKYHKKLDFFNKEAGFNKNPFQIAYKLKKSILVFFVAYSEKQTYKIKHLKIELDYTKKENLAVEAAMKEYVNILEETLKEYPNQWFNFYNFWGE